MAVAYEDFLARIVEDGIAAARRDYANKPTHQRGAVAGFEACRGKRPAELAELLEGARCATRQACTDHYEVGGSDIGDYWETRCYEAEIEWVCNCVSAALRNEGERIIVTPTVRGLMKAAEILGVERGDA